MQPVLIITIIILNSQQIAANQDPVVISSTLFPCGLSCEECGFNSKHCVFNPLKCTIKCECKVGFIGERCTETETKTTKVIDSDQDFYYLKEKSWNQILTQLSNATGLNQPMTEACISNIDKLFNEIFLENKLDSEDVFKLSFAFRKLNGVKLNSFMLNGDLIESIFKLIDNLITANKFILESSDKKLSVFTEANAKYNKASLNLFESLDELIKHTYLDRSNNSLRLKFKNFESLLISLHNTAETINDKLAMNQSIEIKTQPLIYMHHLIDSISINETILKRRYKNNTIKVSFKIYFNYNTNLKDTSQEEDFYKKLQDNQTNFFYEIIRVNSTNLDEEKNISDELSRNFFISSNVLSAVIYDSEQNKQDDYIINYTKEENQKFVRIQFGVNLNLLNSKNKIHLKAERIENYLKCVFWHPDLLRWSNFGCVMSIDESSLIDTYAGIQFYQKVCYCNHLTNFALLFDPESKIVERNLTESTSKKGFEKFFNNFLEILTYVGISTSSICYIVLIVSRILSLRNNNQQEKECKVVKSILKSTIKSEEKLHNFLGKMETSRSTHANYRDNVLRHFYLANTISLLIANVLFLCVICIKPKKFVESKRLKYCYFIASLLHYFILMSFCFSLSIAWQHFIKLAKVFNTPNNACHYRSKRTYLIIKWNLFAFSYPLAFAVYGFVSKLKAEHQTQRSLEIIPNNCWLEAPDLYYLFVIPLLLLLAVSLLIYIFVFAKVVAIYNYSICLNARNCFIANSSTLAQSSNSELLNSSYTNRRVVILLSFSFITMGLTWLLGIFIIVAAKTSSSSLKMFFDFLFCLFNGFHGVSLLIGNWLARKYSRSGDLVTSKFTKTTLISSTEKDKANNNLSELSSVGESNQTFDKTRKKLGLASKFYLFFYGFFYFFFRMLKSNKKEEMTKASSRSSRKSASSRRKKNRRNNLSKKNGRKSTFFEFSIVDSDSNSNNMNCHTIQTNCTSEKHIYNEYLPTYFTNFEVFNNEKMNKAAMEKQDIKINVTTEDSDVYYTSAF